MNLDLLPGPKAFARYMLEGDRLRLRPMFDELMTFRGGAVESILFREGHWQVELISVMPNAASEMHRHLRCASADLLLNGSVFGKIGDRTMGKGGRGPLAAQLMTIGRRQWHGGFAGPSGLVYLSFQHWIDEPTFISQDWEPMNGSG